jgi:hypothetical protein
MRTVVVLSAFTLLLVLGSTEASASPCNFQTPGTTMRLLANCTTDVTIAIPNGATLDGQGYTITAIDPPGGHFLGAVVKNAGAVASVKNLKIAAVALTDVCDTGSDVLRGIQLVDASGSIVGNTITGINQGSSSTCGEGNAIVVSASPQDGTHPATKPVLIAENRIVDAQQLGISVVGDVSAKITGNRISGGVGAPSVRTGISIGNGALGAIVLNSVTHPSSTTTDSVGIRLSASNKVLISGNALSGSSEGIFVISSCTTGAPANQNQILLNSVRVLSEGVDLVSRSTTTSICNPHVDRNVVIGNLIELVGAPSAPTSGVRRCAGLRRPPSAKRLPHPGRRRKRRQAQRHQALWVRGLSERLRHEHHRRAKHGHSLNVFPRFKLRLREWGSDACLR